MRVDLVLLSWISKTPKNIAFCPIFHLLNNYKCLLERNAEIQSTADTEHVIFPACSKLYDGHVILTTLSYISFLY